MVHLNYVQVLSRGLSEIICPAAASMRRVRQMTEVQSWRPTTTLYHIWALGIGQG